MRTRTRSARPSIRNANVAGESGASTAGATVKRVATGPIGPRAGRGGAIGCLYARLPAVVGAAVPPVPVEPAAGAVVVASRSAHARNGKRRMTQGVSGAVRTASSAARDRALAGA